MYYTGWLLAYVVASGLSWVLGIPYPIALVLILVTWLMRDRIDPARLGRLFGGASAFKEAQRAVEINPHDADAHFELGRRLFERGRHGEAVPHLKAAVERMESSAEVQYYLGAALARSEGPRAGEPHLRRALAIDPRFRQGAAHLALSEALVADGRADEAYALLMDFFGAETSNVEALYRMGEAARAAGREAEAEAAFQRAKQAFRTNPRFRRRLDRGHAIRARRALGERVIADKLALAAIVAAGIVIYLWRVL